MRFATIFAAISLVVSMAPAAPIDGTTSSTKKAPDKKESHDWPIYGGTPENNHFSSLTQINRKNVKRLRVAWTFDTEESGGLQTSPIVVQGVLYGLTPSQKVFALNAATGKLLWKFDSGNRGTQPDRGLAYWSDGEGKDKNKDRRILVGVMNFVYALDAATGKAIASFGKDGRIDLRDDLERDPAVQSIYMTSPAVIYKDLMIVGGREAETLPASFGDVRAYDVRSGKLRWSFHTIPRPRRVRLRHLAERGLENEWRGQ
ncbi:MAG: PQQ-binding-like beta-propeller repeat protein [Candidatus Sulfotelmatobacter sp.]